jgi:predicted transposase/invertase (TIGR01784 family)
LLAETIFIIFAELAGFDKTLEECVTAQDRMLYVLKNLGRLKNRPQWLQNEIYECIFRACEISAFTEEKRIEYEKEMNDEKRLNGMMRAKLEEGIEQGIEQGVSQTIRQLHSKGMPASQIADFLDMSLDQVESILAEK